MVHFSYNSYNLTISYNSYLAYEVVFLNHLRSSTGAKGTPLECFRLCVTFFAKKKVFTEGSPFYFWYFPTEGMLKNPKGSPFQFFRHWDFFQKLFFIKRSPIHQYFDILKSFCYFWALDMAPTWAGPGLFFLMMRIASKCIYDLILFTFIISSLLFFKMEN